MFLDGFCLFSVFTFFFSFVVGSSIWLVFFWKERISDVCVFRVVVGSFGRF